MRREKRKYVARRTIKNAFLRERAVAMEGKTVWKIKVERKRLGVVVRRRERGRD